MKYRDGYRYQLVETEVLWTRLRPENHISTPFITLEVNGRMEIKWGYAYDGPSGPTIDSPSSMTPSLYHDVGYQLLRMGLLPPEDREIIDAEFYSMLIARKMWEWRAKWWYRSVRALAASAADPKNRKPVLTAP